MKKIVCIVLSTAILLSMLTALTYADNKITAAKTASRILIDGKEKRFDAYNINGNNYFKLRDIAFVLSGSSSQFDVTWDASKNAINLVSGKPYTVVGGEMQSSTAQTTRAASLTTSRIYLNGKEIPLTAYNIAGSNYFKLRDVAASLAFSVDYDDITKEILINTRVKIDDPEILQAISYGFVPQEIRESWDKTITFKQFCTMLENMLSLYDSKLVPEWEKTALLALKSNDTMHRDHGMLATYYAACLMGIGQTTNSNWHLDQEYGIEVGEGFDNNFSKWFPYCSKPAPFYDIEFRKHISGWDYVTCAKYFCMGQTSCVSGNQIFDVDYVHKTIRPMANFSRKEAIHAVLRLYESTLKQTDRTIGSDKKSAEILALADKRKSSIINSDTTITKGTSFVQGKTYTGAAYYVSNSGNDSNDGMSPETSWASMNKVNSVELKYGDAVFFKRGDIWYDQLWGQSGVTYSAYGTGSKPVISGSVAEAAAAPDKWKLYYADKNGKKIWVYYRELRDCSGVFFNGGTSWANKVTPRWSGKQYVFDTGKNFDAITGLTQNLDYFSSIDLTKINPLDKVMETGAAGPLYLRCDAGNPGELFSNIDFILDGSGISPVGYNGKDMTVDNLKVVFFGNVGISSAGYQGWTNIIIQNCEIGWCGGSITNYSNEMGELAIANISGGAIQMSGSNNTAISNYIHHCASKALVIAIHVERNCSPDFSNTVMKGNILENNAAALHLVNYIESEDPASGAGSFKNIIFEDNYVMYSGYGWVDTKTQRTDYMLDKWSYCSIEFGGEFSNKNSGIYIKNNVFYMAKYALVHCCMPKGNQPIFSGNVYAQGENGWLAFLRGGLYSITQNGEKYMRDELLDKTGTVLTVQ